MFVSIIVPVYNAAKMLNRSIRSILSQTENDWELILVDDGSTDGSTDICLEFSKRDCRVKLFCESNHGVSHARNIGMDNASGQYLYFMDADDWMEKDALQKLREKIGIIDADVVFTGFYKEYKSKTEYVTVCEKDFAVYQSSHAEFNPFHTRLLGTVWGKLYKREFVDAQRFDKSLCLCEDAEFNYRLLPKANKMLYCNFPSYHYVYYGNSAVRGFRPERIMQYENALAHIYQHADHGLEEMKKSVIAFTCNVFSVIVMNNIFNVENRISIGEKIRLLSLLARKEPFNTALHTVDANAISKSQFILVALTRVRLYFGVWLLSVFNQLRSKRMNY